MCHSTGSSCSHPHPKEKAVKTRRNPFCFKKKIYGRIFFKFSLEMLLIMLFRDAKSYASVFPLSPHCPGVPVLLRDLLDAHLQGVQHGPPHGPHLCISARRCAGLSVNHHPAASRRTAGTPGSAGENRNKEEESQSQPFFIGLGQNIRPAVVTLLVEPDNDFRRFLFFKLLISTNYWLTLDQMWAAPLLFFFLKGACSAVAVVQTGFQMGLFKMNMGL